MRTRRFCPGYFPPGQWFKGVGWREDIGLQTRGFGLQLAGKAKQGPLFRMTEMPVVTIQSAGKSVPTAHSKPAGREAAESAQLSGVTGVIRGVSCFQEQLLLAGWLPGPTGPQTEQKGLAQARPPNSPGKIRVLLRKKKKG